MNPSPEFNFFSRQLPLSRVAFLTAFFAATAAPLAAVEEEHLENILGHCAKHRLFGKAPLDGASQGTSEKFARDRLVDVHHLKLDITPDFGNRTIEGVSALTFTPVSKPVRELQLDAVDLTLGSIKATVPIQEYHVADDHIGIVFKKPVLPGQEVTVTTTYSCEPHMGLYFRTPEMGYKEGDSHLWTQGEPELHRHWFPGYDYPNERFTSEVICHVPDKMIVLSNGTLISEKKDAATGLTAFHWRQSRPHVNYLISIVAGHLEKLESKHRDIPLAFYTPPSDFPEAANSFRDTADILAFFEKEIGVPYPWDKYYNVCVQDFTAGGMENTSVTTLTTRTLFTKDFENIRTTRRLDAHEAAHQWFGDLLTCKDWSHLWLNEGFATYYQVLYEEEKFGRDALCYGMLINAEQVLNAKDDKPIVYREYKEPREQFDYRAYPKGAWVLHMLRSQLGASLYRRCIRAYVKRNADGIVVTEDLNKAFEEVSGRSFDRFFDQWVYHGGHPELDIKYAWNAGSKQAKITVTQKQKTSNRVPLFHLRLPVRFVTEKGAHDFELEIDEASEDFFCKLPEPPKIARIDPEYTLLAKIDFTPPAPLLNAQLENEDDMMGRLLAVRALSKQKDKAGVAKIARALREDRFYGVRIEAAKALQAVHTDESFAALRESPAQKDARVRQAVVRAVASFYGDDSLAALREVAKAESNPDIVSDAVEALGKYPHDKVSSLLVATLHRDSYRNHIADAAVRAMRAQDVPSYIQPLLQQLRESESRFTSDGFGRGLETVAYLARNEDYREPVRQLIASHLNHPKEKIRVEAIKALGTLEDPRSLPLLESYPVEPSERPENKAAAEAVTKLNGKKPQSKEVNDLRKEILDLQKKLGDLRKEFDALEKKVEPEKPEKSEPEK